MFYYETTEYINRLKSKLENFEHANRVYETGFIKGLFYSIMTLENGSEFADSKISSDSIRYKGAEVDRLLDKSIELLENPNVSVETLAEIREDLEKVKQNLFT